MSTAAGREPTDLETICKAIAERKKIDPAVVKRAKERSEAIVRNVDDNLSIETLRSIREE